MQSSIKLKENKHLGILFQPRSGSHVLRNFLSNMTSRLDLGEYLSTNSVNLEFNIKEDGYTIIDKSNRGKLAPTLTNDERKDVLDTNLNTLQKMSDIGLYSVFGMPIGNHLKFYPEFSKILSSRQDIQLISLLRADVLYSIISIVICLRTQIWHNYSSKPVNRKAESFYLPIDGLEKDLNQYIRALQDIEQNFNNVEVLYYEEFQFNVNSLRNKFDGFPKRIISMPWSKFQGNYKDLIINLKEVENYYEQFVNEHREYFPQYFGKVPCVQFPACHGHQPRDLSQLQLVV